MHPIEEDTPLPSITLGTAKETGREEHLGATGLGDFALSIPGESLMPSEIAMHNLNANLVPYVPWATERRRVIETLMEAKVAVSAQVGTALKTVGAGEDAEVLNPWAKEETTVVRHFAVSRDAIAVPRFYWNLSRIDNFTRIWGFEVINRFTRRNDFRTGFYFLGSEPHPGKRSRRVYSTVRLKYPIGHHGARHNRPL